MALLSVWDGREMVIAMPFGAASLLVSYFINTTFGLRGMMTLLGLFGLLPVALVFLLVFLARLGHWRGVRVRDGAIDLDRRSGRGITLELDRVIAIESDPERLLTFVPGKSLPINLHTDHGVYRLWSVQAVREQLREAVLRERPEVIDFYGRADMRILPPPDAYQRVWLNEHMQKIHRLLQHANSRSLTVIGVGLFFAVGIMAWASVAVLQGVPTTQAFNRFVLSLILVAGSMAGGKAVQLWRNTRRFRTFTQQLEGAAEHPQDAITTEDGRFWLYRDEVRAEVVSRLGKSFCLMGLLCGCVPVVGFVCGLFGLYHTWVDDHGPWRFIAWLATAIGFFSTSFLVTHIVLAVM